MSEDNVKINDSLRKDIIKRQMKRIENGEIRTLKDGNDYLWSPGFYYL